MKKGISVPEVFTKLLLIASSLVFLYTSGFGSFSTLTQRALHWTFMATALFLLMKPKKLAGNIGKYLFAVVAAVTGIYVIYTWPQRIMGIGTVSTLDQVMGITALALLLISVKLSVGWGLTVTASLFLLYAIFGPVFPGFLGHSGVKIPRLINFLYLTAEGMFGVALGISSTYIIVFVIFGAILNALGGGEWFVKSSYALAGRYRGGPAKTAIVASALMGTVSGAPVANVATTGTFTIPLMKKVGFSPATAGAIEAVASTGGMFLPPVMGAGAFIMAEYLNKPYLEIIKAAIIPSVLFYIALFFIADVRAAKNKLVGMPPDQLPNLKNAVLKNGYHGLSLLFLIVTIVIGWGPMRAAFFATLLAAAFPLVFERKPKEWIKKLVNALYEGSKQTIPIAVACAGAGIIVGVIGVTGLGTKIASGLFNLANGNMLLGLLFTMIAAIILGAGMPVTAVYIILAATLVQPLAAMGVQPIAAHMFIFIFSAMAGLTPPVAITSYTAAGIANADPNKVAIQAFLYGLPGFIIPFMFVISPSLLMQGNAMTVITSVVSALIGVLCLVATIEGYFIVKWPIYLRPLFAAAALLMMWPGGWTDLIGLVIIVVAVLIRWLARAKQPVSV